MTEKILFFALAVSLTAAAVCEAVTDADRMNAGNAAYRAGNWSLAVKKYSGITVSNADLFYNRANAHFKNGQTGKAIVYYNRALRIKPRNTDIRKNLDNARLARADKIETEKKPRVVKAVETGYRALSMNEHAAISIALFTGLAALLFGVVTLGDGKTRTRLKNLAAATAAVLAIESAITGIKTYGEAVTASGVVIVKTATALASPLAGSGTVFVLHDGAEVILGKRENGFVQLKLQTGWTGWLPEGTVEKI